MEPHGAAADAPDGYELCAVDAALLARELPHTDRLREEMCSERDTVEDFLAESFGVAAVRVDLLARQARLRPAGDGPEPAAVLARLRRAGFAARVRSGATDPADELRPAWLRAIVAVALATAAMTWAMAAPHHPASPAVQVALAILALAWPGRAIVLRAVRSALRRHGDMDVLVALGAIGALAHGAVGWALGWDHLHAESAAAILAFTLLGRALEAGGRTRAGAAVRELLARQPPRATRLTAQGEETVDAAE